MSIMICSNYAGCVAAGMERTFLGGIRFCQFCGTRYSQEVLLATKRKEQQEKFVTKAMTKFSWVIGSIYFIFIFGGIFVAGVFEGMMELFMRDNNEWFLLLFFLPVLSLIPANLFFRHRAKNLFPEKERA